MNSATSHLVPSHPVAGSDLHISPVGVSHAVNAVTGFKSTDLKAKPQILLLFLLQLNQHRLYTRARLRPLRLTPQLYMSADVCREKKSVCCLRRAKVIIKDTSYPNRGLFTLLPSGRRYWSLSTRNKLRNSFFPTAVFSWTHTHYASLLNE